VITDNALLLPKELSERDRVDSERDEEYYKSGHLIADAIHQLRVKTIIGLIGQSLPLYPKPKLADLGSGDGILLREIKRQGILPAERLWALDFAPSRVTNAFRQTPNAILANLRFTPLQSSSFELVVCSEVLEHTIDPSAIVQEMIRIAKPGGTIIVSFPNEVLWRFGRLLLGRFPIRHEGHIQMLTPRTVRRWFNPCPLHKTIYLPFHLPWPFTLSAILAFRKPEE
jgi:2-polyprenyl-3-methyl-5-hydroxy-6-metoxy-1,4-benzoquinol methylase